MLLYGQRSYLSLQWSESASQCVCVCVCLCVSSVGVAAAKGSAVCCVTPPSAGSSGCTQTAFTAGWLLRNEPQEASQRRARGISTIINNPVLMEKKHQHSSCSHASAAHCRKLNSITNIIRRGEQSTDRNSVFFFFHKVVFVIMRKVIRLFFCAVFWEITQEINQI